MSAVYLPDESALPIPPWDTIYLANRDLAATVPINFVTHAGASLSSACFANGTFEDSQAAKCLSNLLAAQFSRIVVDIYWNPSSHVFNLCPLSIITESQRKSSSTAPTASASFSSKSASSPSSQLSRETPSLSSVSQADPVVTDSTEAGVSPRQNVSPTASGTSVNVSASSSIFSEAIPVSTTPAGIVLYDIGPYRCSPTLDLQFIASLVKDYIEQTSDTLSANLLFFEFNLHAAASAVDSENQVSSLAAPDLPSSNELVGQVLSSVFSLYSYKPSDLQRQRANLNDSWYQVLPSEQPIPGYFTINPLPGAGINTPDGWPNEYFTELNRYKRILFGYGSIDSRMQGYDFDGERDLMFPSEYLSLPRAVASNSPGQLDSGCFHDSAQTAVGQVNSSWAVSSLNAGFSSSSSPETLGSLTRNLTSCGISPLLSMALDHGSAEENISQYVNFVQSTVWNWAPGEPGNVPLDSATDSDDRGFRANFRCALMMTSSTPQAGRWRVENCDSQHQVACRIANQPYSWRMSSNLVPFSAAETACEGVSAFSAPRTGLENEYLYQHVLSLPEAARSGLSSNDSGVWVNLNSLDVESCWVTTGARGTCPYIVDEEALTVRTVLVPVIAALVVLVLTALTLFVKCNKNRRNSRKRVRGKGGWDYEGVPS